MSAVVTTPLTPPASRHSHKENFLPSSPSRSPTRSRTPASSLRPIRPGRVLFSHKNSHHPHTPPGPPRRLPSSRLFPHPTRSILKRSSVSMTPSHPSETSSDSNVRHSTPEPEDDALLHTEYIVSPLKVIVASLEDMPLTLRDLIEAWATLFTRLRAKFPSEIEAPPALEPFKANLEAVLRALERDVRRALVNPISRQRLTDSKDPTAGVNSEEDCSEVPKRGGLTEFEVTYARDLYLLTSAATKVLSLMTWVPQLYNLCTDIELRSLLATVLAVLNAPSLPTPNPRKTYTLASAVLQVQQLPLRIVAPYQNDIKKILIRGLNGEYGREGKKGATWECLGAVQTFADAGHSEFHPLLEAVTPLVLRNLIAPPTPTIRVKAAAAFGSIANASIRAPLPRVVEAVGKSGSLTRVLEEALTPDEDTDALPDAAWGLTVLASYIVILRHHVFETTFHKTRPFKTVMSCMHSGLNAKKANGVKLAARAIWSSLVWVWDVSRVAGLEGFEDAEGEYGGLLRQHRKDDKGRTISVAIAALLHHPVGSSIVISFLRDPDDRTSVNCGLEVLLEMITRDIPHHLDLLASLLSQDNESEPYILDISKLVCGSILGGLLLNTPSGHDSDSKQQFHTAVRQMVANDCISPSEVRSLTAEEIKVHWDVLLKCWDSILLKASEENAPMLMQLWASMLTARAQVDTSPADLARLGLALHARIMSFLSRPTRSWAHKNMIDGRHDLYCALVVARNLFVVIVERFPTSTDLLAQFVPHLFEDLVQVRAHYLETEAHPGVEDAIQGEYLLLMGEIFRASEKTSLESLLPLICTHLAEENAERAFHKSRAPDSSASMSTSENTLPSFVWAEVWKHFVLWINEHNVEGAASIDELTSLIRCVPALSADVVTPWTIMVKRAVDIAGDADMAPALVEQIIADLPVEHLNVRYRMRAVVVLLSVLPLATLPLSQVSIPRLLTFTDHLLHDNPPDSLIHQKESLAAGLFLLRSVVRIVQAAGSSFLSLLHFVKLGVVSWLEDKSNAIPDNDYNSVVAEVYSNLLRLFKTLPSTAQTLEDIAPFLAAGFSHIPSQLLCPKAFEAFWNETFRPLSDTLEEGDYPDVLKPILRALIQDHGSSFARGLSAGLDSSVTPTPQAAEKTPRSDENHMAEDSAAYEADVSRMTASPVMPAARIKPIRMKTQLLPIHRHPGSISLFDYSSLLESPASGSKSKVSDNEQLDSAAASSEAADVTVVEALVADPPITPSVNRVYDAKRRRHSGDSRPRKRQRVEGVAEDSTADEIDAVMSTPFNLAASLVEGPKSIIRLSRPSPLFASGSRPASQPIPTTPSPRKLINTPSPSRKVSNQDFIGVELPTLKELTSRKPSPLKVGMAKGKSKQVEDSPAMDRDAKSPNSGALVVKEAGSSRPLKRTRSVTRAERLGSLSSLAFNATPVARRLKRYKSALSLSPKQVLSLEIADTPTSSSMPDFDSDDTPHPAQSTDTPETAVRGPRLPASEDTVLSPYLSKVDDDVNPSSDDSMQSNSSPIKGHVKRRMVRSASAADATPRAGPSRYQSTIIRLPSEEFVAHLETAFSSLGSVRALDGDQLLRVRKLLEGISSELPDTKDSPK